MKNPHHGSFMTRRVYSIGVEFSSTKDPGRGGRIKKITKNHATINVTALSTRDLTYVQHGSGI
jgi:hypothetical protein